MADKFLNTGGSGGVNISNGTTDVFAATISAANLDPSRPIKTNAVRELVSSNLDIADVNNLQQELDNVITQPYNGTLKATDFETDNYFSVNDELQKIDNLTASTEAPDTTNITGLLNADEMATGRIYDEAQQTFIELDGTDVAVSATDLTLNGNSVLTVGGTTITDLETKTQNIDLTTTAGQTDITGVIKPDEILIDDIDGVGFSVDIANFEGMKVRDGIKSINYDDDAFMRITSSSNLFRFNWTSADVPANDGDWITYSQSGGTDGVLIISPPNFTNGELQLLGGNITIASDFFVVDCVMNATDFVKYQGGVDYLNPPGLNSLAAVGYVNQQISNIPEIDLNTATIDNNFDEDMTSISPIGVLSPNVVYNQNVNISIPEEGGGVDYPAYSINNGGVLEFDFSFPSGFTGEVQGIELGDSSSIGNNSYVIRYRPDQGTNQLSVLAFINGGSTLPFQATTPAGISSWRITYTASPANLQIEGKVGAGAYVSYVNGAITEAFINAGVGLSSSGIGPQRAMNITRVVLSGATDKLATKGDATASYDKLSTYRKRYDIDNSPFVILQDNKPITYAGVEGSNYSFEIAKYQVGFNVPLTGNAPVEVDVPASYYNKRWNPIYSNAGGGNLSENDSKIGFAQNAGFFKYIGFPIFDVNSTASFKWIATNVAVAGVQYFGITDNTTNFDGLVGFAGQDIAGTYYNDGVAVGGAGNQWRTGDECEIKIIGGTWQIYKNGLPTYNSYPITDNGKPYYFCIINNFGGGNFCEYQITEVITNYVNPTPPKQLTVDGSIDISGNSVYVEDISKSLVYKDNETEIVYPIAGKEVRVVNKFNCAIDNVLYEDDFVRIDWVGLELQPSYVLKILPTGQGAFPDYVDTSITFVGGGASSVGNGDGANVINTKFYFNGSAILDPAFTHINYGSTSRGFLIAENDLNYPSYTLKIATGDVAFLGVAVVERY